MSSPVRRLASGLAIAPIRTELACCGGWQALDPHGSEAIILRGPLPIAGVKICDNHLVVDQEGWSRTEETKRLILEFLRLTGGTLGRVQAIRLAAGSRIAPQIDPGDYGAIRDRHLLLVDGVSGVNLALQGDNVTMRAGEIWQFQPNHPHRISNEASQHPCVLLIFDIMPRHRPGVDFTPRRAEIPSTGQSESSRR